MGKTLQLLFQKLELIFDPARIADVASKWILNLLIAAIVFLVFFLVWFVARGLFMRFAQKSKLDPTSSALIAMMIKSILFIIALLITLGAMGIGMSTVLASIGVVGLTIGFAAKDTLSNLIAGFMIFIDRPFVIGDIVEIDSAYGTVDRITIRSTRVITPDGKMLAVPNTEVINTTVASYTNFPHLRLGIPFAVGLAEDLGQIRKLVNSIVTNNEAYLTTPPPRTIVKSLDDYSIALEFQVWLKDETLHVEKRSELKEKILVALSEAGVDMPFQTITLTPINVNLVDVKSDTKI